MFYRETGQFKSKYKEELAAFPLAEDKVGIAILLVIAYVFNFCSKNNATKMMR